MKIRQPLLALALCAVAGSPVAFARRLNQTTSTTTSATTSANQQSAAPVAAAATPTETDSRADAYYDFTLGHYYQQEYEITSAREDADRAIEFYKKAYALDPGSQQVSEELAEMYFQAQRIREAVSEAQSVLSKDPDNLSARRLLARIYVRSLGDLSDTSGQRDTLVRAVEQYREIVRLDPADTDAALWLGRLYRLQNDNDKAEVVFRNVLAREPENTIAAEQLAQLLTDQGKSQDAVTLLKGILDRTPKAQLWGLLGEAYTQTHDLADAEQAFTKAEQAQPGDIDHRRSLAQTLLNEEKYPQALEQYQQLAEMDPEDPASNLRLAEIYRQMKQLDKAEQNVLLAKKLAPGNLEVIYDEASIYEDEGRFEDSTRVLSDAVTAVKAQPELTPSRSRTLAILYLKLGQIYREVSNYPAAVNTFEEMQRLGADDDLRARAMIIDTYRLARDFPHAMDAANKAIEAYPKDRSIRATQGLLYAENGQTDQGVSLLRQLLNGSPADFEVQIDLAQAYEDGHRWPEAEQAIQAAEKISAQPSDQEVSGFLLGAILERQKKFDLAEEQFRRVLKENPDNASVLNYYGYMLADRGIRLDEATGMIRKALEDDPDNSAYQDSMGWAYFKQNKFTEAEEFLRKAVSRDSHDPTILSHLGDLFAKTGKDELAEAEWQKSIDEWHHVLPADLEPDKLAEVEQKISALKRRLAQQKAPADPKP